MASKHTPSPTRAELIAAFEAAPDNALFDQITVAAVFGCSRSKLERDRWAGTGVPYRKAGWQVRYSTSDVLAALAALPAYRPTSEDPEATRRARLRRPPARPPPAAA